MDFNLTSLTTDYGDPIAEAAACRTSAALFDFSFMSRAVVSGPGAVKLIAKVTRRLIADLPVGRIRYAVRETPNGYLAADLTVWRTGNQDWEVMSGRHVDIADLVAASKDDDATEVQDLTAETRIYAVQGPRALDALRPFVSAQAAQQLEGLSYYATGDFVLAGVPVRFGRLGYTGEQGFELLVPASESDVIWQALSQRARPAGFIAADMLRIEAGFVLFANEFRIPVTALEAGLGNFADGISAAESHSHPMRNELKLVAFRSAANADATLFQPPPTVRRPTQDNELIVTSACNSIVAGGILGLGYVLKDRDPSASLRDPTGLFRAIKLATRPYFDPQKLRPRAPWS